MNASPSLHVLDVREHRVVVRGCAAGVLLEAYLGGSVLALHFLGALHGSPVGVGEDAVAVDAELRREEDVVYAARAEAVGVEGVERAVLGEAQACRGVRVLQYARVGEYLEYLVVLVYVEVARHHHGSALGYLAYLAHYELGGLTTRHDAHVVHVQVEVVELESRLQLLELSPRADAYACRVPAQLGRVGGLVEPEVAVVEELEVVFLVEYGRVLAGLLAVVAAHAYVVVVVECGTHVAELLHEHLLCAEGIGSLEVHLIAEHLAARGPHVAVLLVALVAVANVVGAHIERLCAQGCRHEQCHGGGNESFSHIIVCKLLKLSSYILCQALYFMSRIIFDVKN